jgi:hypothetical protein
MPPAHHPARVPARAGSRCRSAGATSATLLVTILVVAVAAGAGNYYRNYVKEQQERAARPLSGYATADLEALANAYRARVQQLSQRYDGVRSQRHAAKDRGFFGDQIDEYERVRRKSDAVRDLGGDLSQTEAALHEVELELQARKGMAGGTWQVHLHRLLTI